MINKLILQIQNLKTSIFDIAALIYGIGLLNWSIYSYNNRLGIISAIDTQYFTAGLIPFLLLAIAYYALISEFSIYKKVSNYIRSNMREMKRKDPEKFKRRARIILWVVGLPMLSASVYFGITTGEYWIMAYGSPVLVILLYSARNSTNKAGAKFKQQRMNYNVIVLANTMLVAYSKFIITLFAFGFIILYALLWYPTLPQELGGARPKPCILECKKGTYNISSTSLLFTDTSSSILRSKPVDVCYYNSDKIIISYDSDSAGHQIAELNRKDIVLINWLD